MDERELRKKAQQVDNSAPSENFDDCYAINDKDPQSGGDDVESWSVKYNKLIDKIKNAFNTIVVKALDNVISIGKPKPTEEKRMLFASIKDENLQAALRLKAQGTDIEYKADGEDDSKFRKLSDAKTLDGVERSQKDEKSKIVQRRDDGTIAGTIDTAKDLKDTLQKGDTRMVQYKTDYTNDGALYVYSEKADPAKLQNKVAEIASAACSGANGELVPRTAGVVPVTDGMGRFNYIGGHSLSENGWCKLPNGLIIQWGIAQNDGTGRVNFPIVFPSRCFRVVFAWFLEVNVMRIQPKNRAGDDWYDTAGFYLEPTGTTNIRSPYIAIGY